MALMLLKFYKGLSTAPKPAYPWNRLKFSTLNFRQYARFPQGVQIRSSALFRERTFPRLAASTTKVEQMFAAVKINDYKDKALKAGLTDELLADEEALVELLEKVGVPGGFAMKARAWARRNAPKPEKAAEGTAAAPAAAAAPPPPPPTAVVLEAIEKTKLGEFKDAILKTGLSDYTIFTEEEWEKALEKAGVGGGMIMKARAWHRRNLAGKTPPKPPEPGAAAAASTEIPEAPLPEDEFPPIEHPIDAAQKATARAVGMTDAFLRGARMYYDSQANERAKSSAKPKASSPSLDPTVPLLETIAVLSEQAASNTNVPLARFLLLLLLLYLIFSNERVQQLLQTFDDVPVLSILVSKLHKTSEDDWYRGRSVRQIDATQQMVMIFANLRRRHQREKEHLVPLSIPTLTRTVHN